jgi:hypothetical protein
MSLRLSPAQLKRFSVQVFPIFLVVAALAIVPTITLAQQQVSKRFTTGSKVRFVLRNISGKVIVEAWNRNEVTISATLESPKATVTPRQLGEGVLIDVVSDNRGRADIGSVNFKVRVPRNSTVDIETKMGDISIANIQNDVRAYVSSEGDIELTGINSAQVFAQNKTGNIFFDGEVIRGGSYQFQTTKGEISLRIPANSTFDLTASAPDKRLALGQFWNSSFRTLGGEGQKYSKTIGDVNDGRARVTIRNFEGGITFIRR